MIFCDRVLFPPSVYLGTVQCGAPSGVFYSSRQSIGAGKRAFALEKWRQPKKPL